MVRSCSAYNCKNRHGKLKKDGKKLPFHRFPLQNIDLLKKWIEAVKRKDWKLTKASCLCGDHFLEADYVSSACCYLKPNAVPSVFDFSSPPKSKRKNCTLPTQNPSPISHQLKSPDVDATTLDHATPQSSTLRALEINSTKSRDDKLTPHVENQTLPEQNPSPISNQLSCLDVKPILDHITPQCSTLQAPVVGKTPAWPDKLTPCKKNHLVSEQKPSSTSNQLLLCPDVKATPLGFTRHQTLGAGNSTAVPDDGLTPSNRTKMLQKKVKVLQERLRRRDKKIEKLESMLLMAQRCCSKSSDTSQMLKDTYGDFPCEILINILSNKSKKPGAHRYSKSIMEFSATLYYNSPSIYKFLRSKLSLPHPSYIRSKDIVASSEEDNTEAYVSPVIIPIKKE